MKRIVFLAMAILPLLFFTACDKDPGGTGTLKLYITDAPIDTDDIKGVFVTVSEIQYHTYESGWQKFSDYEGPRTFNLLDLQRGNSELLGSFELKAGTYTQIRFMLDAPVRGAGNGAATGAGAAPVAAGGPPFNPGCWLEFADNTTQALFVPSGAQTGYKAVGKFTVPENGSIEVTADFDVRKSVVKAGNSGKYILKPTIRLLVNETSGQISGTVANIPEETEVVVYAYKTGTYEGSEADDPADEETRFPNAVSSDMVDEDGKYYLAFLDAGSYDLVVAVTINGEFLEVAGIIENVPVERKETTVVNIDFDDLD